MKRVLPLLMALLLGVLVLLGAGSDRWSRADRNTSGGAVQTFFQHVKDRDFDAAYSLIASSSNLDKRAFVREIAGSNDSLKTISSLDRAESKIISESSDRANVRATLEWSTAVGALTEQRDLQLIRESGDWKILWPKTNEVLGELRTEPTDYLRWDIVQRGGSGRDDWGGQNVEPPRMRIVSMNAIEREGRVIILGEVVNEDTVPGFVTVSASLIDKNGNPFVEESSFDKISHTLLPKEVSPFRVDFANVKLADLKSVRLNPTTLLIPASADPVVGVMNQRLEKDLNGRGILRGELVNQSGKPVNIPHVLATFYDNAGRVIWVSDGYVQSALLPKVPVGFSLAVREDMLKDVQSYRVTVNHYSADRS